MQNLSVFGMSFNSCEVATTMYRFNSFNVFKQLSGGIFDYVLDEVQEWSFKEVIIYLYSFSILKMWLLLVPMFQDHFDRKQISSIGHTTKFVLAGFDCDLNFPGLSCGVISVCPGWVRVWFHQNFQQITGWVWVWYTVPFERAGKGPPSSIFFVTENGL